MKSIKLFSILIIAVLTGGCGTMISINVRPTGIIDAIRMPRTCRANILIYKNGEAVVPFVMDALPLHEEKLYIGVETFAYDGWHPIRALLYQDGKLIGVQDHVPFGNFCVGNLHDGADHLYTLRVAFANDNVSLDDLSELVSDPQEYPYKSLSFLTVRHYRQ